MVGKRRKEKNVISVLALCFTFTGLIRTVYTQNQFNVPTSGTVNLLFATESSSSSNNNIPPAGTDPTAAPPPDNAALSSTSHSIQELMQRFSTLESAGASTGNFALPSSDLQTGQIGGSSLVNLLQPSPETSNVPLSSVEQVNILGVPSSSSTRADTLAVQVNPPQSDTITFSSATSQKFGKSLPLTDVGSATGGSLVSTQESFFVEPPTIDMPQASPMDFTQALNSTSLKTNTDLTNTGNAGLLSSIDPLLTIPDLPPLQTGFPPLPVEPLQPNLQQPSGTQAKPNEQATGSQSQSVPTLDLSPAPVGSSSLPDVSLSQIGNQELLHQSPSTNLPGSSLANFPSNTIGQGFPSILSTSMNNQNLPSVPSINNIGQELLNQKPSTTLPQSSLPDFASSTSGQDIPPMPTITMDNQNLPSISSINNIGQGLLNQAPSTNLPESGFHSSTIRQDLPPMTSTSMDNQNPPSMPSIENIGQGLLNQNPPSNIPESSPIGFPSSTGNDLPHKSSNIMDNQNLPPPTNNINQAPPPLPALSPSPQDISPMSSFSTNHPDIQVSGPASNIVPGPPFQSPLITESSAPDGQTVDSGQNFLAGPLPTTATTSSNSATQMMHLGQISFSNTTPVGVAENSFPGQTSFVATNAGQPATPESSESQPMPSSQGQSPALPNVPTQQQADRMPEISQVINTGHSQMLLQSNTVPGTTSRATDVQQSPPQPSERTFNPFTSSPQNSLSGMEPEPMITQQQHSNKQGISPSSRPIEAQQGTSPQQPNPQGSTTYSSFVPSQSLAQSNVPLIVNPVQMTMQSDVTTSLPILPQQSTQQANSPVINIVPQSTGLTDVVPDSGTSIPKTQTLPVEDNLQASIGSQVDQNSVSLRKSQVLIKPVIDLRAPQNSQQPRITRPVPPDFGPALTNTKPETSGGALHSEPISPIGGGSYPTPLTPLTISPEFQIASTGQRFGFVGSNQGQFPGESQQSPSSHLRRHPTNFKNMPGRVTRYQNRYLPAISQTSQPVLLTSFASPNNHAFYSQNRQSSVLPTQSTNPSTSLRHNHKQWEKYGALEALLDRNPAHILRQASLLLNSKLKNISLKTSHAAPKLTTSVQNSKSSTHQMQMDNTVISNRSPYYTPQINSFQPQISQVTQMPSTQFHPMQVTQPPQVSVNPSVQMVLQNTHAPTSNAKVSHVAPQLSSIVRKHLDYISKRNRNQPKMSQTMQMPSTRQGNALQPQISQAMQMPSTQFLQMQANQPSQVPVNPSIQMAKQNTHGSPSNTIQESQQHINAVSAAQKQQSRMKQIPSQSFQAMKMAPETLKSGTIQNVGSIRMPVAHASVDTSQNTMQKTQQVSTVSQVPSKYIAMQSKLPTPQVPRVSGESFQELASPMPTVGGNYASHVPQIPRESFQELASPTPTIPQSKTLLHSNRNGIPLGAARYQAPRSNANNMLMNMFLLQQMGEGGGSGMTFAEIAKMLNPATANQAQPTNAAASKPKGVYYDPIMKEYIPGHASYGPELVAPTPKPVPQTSANYRSLNNRYPGGARGVGSSYRNGNSVFNNAIAMMEQARLNAWRHIKRLPKSFVINHFYDWRNNMGKGSVQPTMVEFMQYLKETLTKMAPMYMSSQPMKSTMKRSTRDIVASWGPNQQRLSRSSGKSGDRK